MPKAYRCEERRVDAYIATQRYRRSAETDPGAATAATDPVVTPQQKMRGMTQAQGEWALVCLCHNVRKLWVARRAERLPTIT